MEQIIDIGIKLVVTAVGIFAGYALQEAKKYLQAKLSNEQQAKLENLVKTLVEAAEQMYKTEDPDGSVRLGYVQHMLIEAGFDLTDTVRAIIESQVKNLNAPKK